MTKMEVERGGRGGYVSCPPKLIGPQGSWESQERP